MTASFVTAASIPQAIPYTTAAQTDLRLTAEAPLRFTTVPQVLETDPTVFVDASKQFQTFVGIGGAITDAAAETFAKLAPAAQEELLQAYFDPQKGIGYTLARTNIASCDFSSGSYAYVADQDVELKTFSVAPDTRFRIPLLRRATAAAGGALPLFASPWSPPGWMKDTGNVLQGGKLRPEYRQAWANHYVAFARAYAEQGVPLWGLSVQNEPLAKQRWESCLYTAEEERDFIRDYLGPTLHRAGLADLKLIAWDHNRDLIYQRARTILGDPAAARYVWGIGFHWYETWTGGGMQFQNLQRVQEAFPETHLIFTEGCKERFALDQIGDWTLGERYAYSMVHDFNAGTVAWCDWNILLDETGGPNHVGNFCFAPIHGDTRTGQLLYTNAYHYIGHFSKFIRPGARRITTSSTRDFLETTGFLNPDGTVAVVILNRSDKELDYQLWLDGHSAPLKSRAHSITTVVLR